MQNGGMHLQLQPPAQSEPELVAVVQLAKQGHAMQQQQMSSDFLMDEHLLDDGADLDYVEE